MRLKSGAASDTGRVRKLNEDAYAVRAEQGLFVVCDGMGGAAAGEVASQLAVQTIVEHFNGAAPQPASESQRAEGFLPRTKRLADAIKRANQAIYDQAQAESAQAGMGTTVVGVWLEANIVSVAHVGDSRAYRWHEQRLEALTSDHSLVEAEVRAGLIDREHSMHSEYQNILLRALGREPDVEVELSEVPVKPGDYVLLCSDGLTRMVTDGTLADTIARLRAPQRICEALVTAANDNGGVDNVTVVVVQIASHRFSAVWQRLTG
jgi:serine/threonine protein phosphatase PrpC